MKCQRCNERDARVHLTEIKDGKKTELDLCEACAKGMGLAGLVEPAIPEETRKITCSSCGTTFRAFISSGRLGCSKCYEAFGEHLEDILLKSHSASRHKGKVPQRLSGTDRKRRVLEYLRQELDRAVKLENYEQAAFLRDRIATMETENAPSP